MSTMRSGQLAAEAGVNVQTLRYYERRGLLPEPSRTLGGHRVYPADAVRTVRVIKSAQRLGFSLAEVAELVDAARHRHGRGQVNLRDHVAAKLGEVEARIADLRIIRDALRSGLNAECDDLEDCLESEECPLSLAELASPVRRASTNR